MSRRIVSLTLDVLEDLPRRCRGCVFWELDPVAAEQACDGGDAGFEKELWVSAALLEWGACGRVAYEGDTPVGFVLYAPPSYVPRAAAFPSAPVSADAVLLTTAHVLPEYAGRGLGRELLQAAAKDLAKRGIKAIEVFGDQRGEEHACVAPADFLRSVGFKTVRADPHYPRLRLELRTALSWRAEVDRALDQLLATAGSVLSSAPKGTYDPVRRSPG
ncbi:GNAT family N-acetyltransferase [Actinorhabdospora filicis]|uniref:GNAT family N-acetyltransferase n=1 Tax=Actinorhabdospora filicis TaxID=1785913 RepID=UPI0025557F48|nr:GNAT family N-acetyltransferase [Actinorhabdospora filicis]